MSPLTADPHILAGVGPVAPGPGRGPVRVPRPAAAVTAGPTPAHAMSKPTPEPIDPARRPEVLAEMQAARFPLLAFMDADRSRVRPVSPVATGSRCRRPTCAGTTRRRRSPPTRRSAVLPGREARPGADHRGG